ncbi:hypothetical protein ALC57_15406 [Trachymyrmex cornetzi]|uniref:SWIM-type domain-containing protein n=1 Tax=Trachymyrmex cornetzi TaxID=471704 RepID=A0A151IXB6_9HYME|nr:hypothetical protein ALC57_15406 [Trachymyrmex cornetzi]
MAFRNLLTCFVCNNRYQPRLMRRIDGENNDAKRDIAILRRDNAGLPALEVNDQTRLCMNCNISILEEIDLILQDERHMRLNVLTQTRSASCLICDQEDNVERLCMKARVNIFITSNIYIPNNVRSCRIHLDGRGFLLQPLHAGLSFTLLDIRYYMPEPLEHGQSQLTTEQANQTRVITKTRWIVEARNGYIKSIFKFLAQVVRIPHAPHIGDFYRIVGAIINRYHQPIHMDGCDAEAARRILARSQEVNEVQARVAAENLQRRRQTEWERIDQNQLVDFPHLTLNYLQDLTLGVYQLFLAPSYIQDSLLRQNNVFEVDLRAQEQGFARFRLFSRFRNAASHHQFISYNPNEENQLQEENSILGYYCTCKTGARTLGTCAHIASILWYLGFAI